MSMSLREQLLAAGLGKKKAEQDERRAKEQAERRAKDQAERKAREQLRAVVGGDDDGYLGRSHVAIVARARNSTALRALLVA